MHDLYNHAQRLVATSQIPTLDEYLDIIRLAFRARRSLGNCPVFPVYKEFILIAGLLYRREKFDHITPPPSFADPIEEARYRDLVKKEIHRLERVGELIDAFTHEMVELFENFTDGLPLMAIQMRFDKDEPPTTTVPLIDVIDVREPTTFGVTDSFCSTFSIVMRISAPMEKWGDQVCTSVAPALYARAFQSSVTFRPWASR